MKKINAILIFSAFLGGLAYANPVLQQKTSTTKKEEKKTEKKEVKKVPTRKTQEKKTKK